MSNSISKNRLAVWAFGIAFVAGLTVETGILARKFVSDPSFVFLVSSHGADWIRDSRPMDIALLPEGIEHAWFEKQFTIVSPPESAILRFRALETAEVFWDDTQIFADSDQRDTWKQWREVDLTAHLSPGPHTLRVRAQRVNGRPLVQAYCLSLGLYSGHDWKVSADGEDWTAGASASRIEPVEGSRAFPDALSSLLRVLPILAVAFVLGALVRWGAATGRIRGAGLDVWGIRLLRGGMILALAVLGVNNLYRVPAWFGFDVEGHMQYIHYIAQFSRLPLAPDGWKMNEAPLFHLISSIPYRLIYTGLTVEQNTVAMRVIPILCGLLQVEIAFRTIRLAFPTHRFAQALGTAICALLPMNIYLSQFPSNQPFVGVLAAVGVYFAVRLAVLSPNDARWPEWVLMGLALGLAVLSKITALLVLPGALIAASLSVLGAARPCVRWRPAVLAPSIVLVVVVVVSGWYFVRNQLAFGSPFSVGYSESLGTVWRQDPGFRAPGQLLTFGEGLLHPVHACFVGYWDSLYSTFWSDGMISSGQVPAGYEYGQPLPPSVPPWNFAMLGAATLLSLAPLSLMLLGAGGALMASEDPVRRGMLLSLFLIGTHLAGMVYLYLTLPMVSAGKAAYLLNVLPCFGLLAAQGAVNLERRLALSMVTSGLICAWGVASYLAFFAT